MPMETCPDSIKRLIEHFDRQQDQVCSPDYNETQLRIDFVNPMFRELGWDLDNTQGFAEQYREVVHEDRVKVSGATKAPDYSFRIGGNRKFFLETKKPSVNIKQNWEPAYQLRRYGWSAKLAVSLLTDFEELAVYDCRIAPKQFDKASVARREYVHYHDYLNRWDFIEGTFSKRAVLQGEFDRYCETRKGRGSQEFDEAFLEEIEEWRKKLASNLALRNEGLDERLLNFAVQRIIDRIIFLRICEDRGIEHAGQLQALMNGDNVYPRLLRLFRNADDRYNSGIFHFKAEKGRDEPPDELTPSLEIDDATLKGIFQRLYYPESPYEFTVISVDILGSVYERFLGKVITLTSGHRAKIEEKPEVRKAGGVYYTPTYIVDYIVKQTVGRLLGDVGATHVSPSSPMDKGEISPAPATNRTNLRQLTIKEAAKLKILDPACGSGSFLLGAYQYMLDWHLKWYITDGVDKWSKGKNAALRPGPAGDWRLTIRERKRILLNNIHGVDIDYQAVEVTKLSLLLRVLEGETAESIGGLWAMSHERALPDLGRNIQCGNSLIGSAIMSTDAWKEMTDDQRRRINPFDYERAFPQVFKQSGFDAVIGNPPYIFTRDSGISEPEKVYFNATYEHQSVQLNTFGVFVEKSLRLLRCEARLGFITPNNWLTITTFVPLRQLLLYYTGELNIINILDRVFAAADVDTAILTCRKVAPGRVTVAEMQNKVEIFTTSVDRHEFREPDLIIQISLLKDPDARKLLDHLNAISEPLSDFATVSTGLKAYQTGKGNPSQTDLVKISRQFHSSKRDNATYGKYLEGVDVCRYCLDWSGEYLSYGNWLAEPRRSVPFSGPRILVRQIPSNPPYMVHGVWADKPYYNDINSMIVFDVSAAISLKSLLGIINSRLISFWFARTYDKMQRRIFPQFKVKELARFPISKQLNSKRNDARLTSLVNSMLAFHAQGQSAKHPQEKEQLRRQIESTDRQIDQLVYELYDLNDEDIRIVESATG